MATIYDSKDILSILPHRHPFILVDRIVECNDTDWIVGIKNVAANEPCFQGHFPGMPIFPGVLQLEAMAQTAGILLNKVLKSEGKVAFYLGVDGAKFRRMVVPGDQVRMEAELTKVRGSIGRLTAKAYVDGELAAEGEFTFALSRKKD